MCVCVVLGAFSVISLSPSKFINVLMIIYIKCASESKAESRVGLMSGAGVRTLVPQLGNVLFGLPPHTALVYLVPGPRGALTPV